MESLRRFPGMSILLFFFFKWSFVSHMTTSKEQSSNTSMPRGLLPSDPMSCYSKLSSKSSVALGNRYPSNWSELFDQTLPQRKPSYIDPLMLYLIFLGSMIFYLIVSLITEKLILPKLGIARVLDQRRRRG